MSPDAQVGLVKDDRYVQPANYVQLKEDEDNEQNHEDLQNIDEHRHWKFRCFRYVSLKSFRRLSRRRYARALRLSLTGSSVAYRQRMQGGASLIAIDDTDDPK